MRNVSRLAQKRPITAVTSTYPEAKRPRLDTQTQVASSQLDLVKQEATHGVIQEVAMVVVPQQQVEEQHSPYEAPEDLDYNWENDVSNINVENYDPGNEDVDYANAVPLGDV